MLFRRGAGRHARRSADNERPAASRPYPAAPAAGYGQVWLVFADSSRLTLAADDPTALALRAVADAMLRRR